MTSAFESEDKIKMKRKNSFSMNVESKHMWSSAKHCIFKIELAIFIKKRKKEKKEK
jgi:hypothetical protein